MTKSRSPEDFPQVGILACSRNIAASLAQELGIKRPVMISPRCMARIRGQSLSVLVVDEELWPLAHDVESAVLPALSRSGGYILRMLRVDPRKRELRRWHDTRR
jgi:hypothetical protein